MNRRMRELQLLIAEKAEAAKGYTEGDHKDIAKAQEILEEIKGHQTELDTLGQLEQIGKAEVPGDDLPTQKADGFSLMAKMLHKKALNQVEKAALVTGENSTGGEGYLVPEDVRTEINELRKSYVSAKDIVTVDVTDALAGSYTYEAGTPAGLSDLDDGDDLTEEDGVKFVAKKFAIKHFGKLIPVSRILLNAAKASIMNYLNRWFVKNAIITENKKIFDTLKAGYNSGTPKALAGWKALKKSINKDLDPSCLYAGVIVTNQSGFACLDEEEDKDGRPVLQPNPADPTQKIFQGLPIKVYPDAQLPNIDATHFPVIYGDTMAGATFVEHQNLEFMVSEHYLFNRNQNCIRVVEGFDVMSADTDAYIYGSFTASAT